MSQLSALLLLESKRFAKKWNLILWLTILVLILISVNKSVNDFEQFPAKKQKFKEIQANYFKNTINYEVYSRGGVKLFFDPAPGCIISDDSVVPPDMVAKVDSIVMLQIYNNLKGKSLARGIFPWRPDFSNLVFLVITLMAMGSGLAAIGNKEYLTFLAGVLGQRRVFPFILLSRFLLFIAGFLLVSGISLLYILSRGVVITAADGAALAGYLVETSVLLLFFFALGALIGTWRSLPVSYAIKFISWFIAIAIIPAALGIVAESSFPDSSRDYQTELNNFKALVDFEHKSEKEYGKFDRNRMDVAKKVIEKYWETDYKEIEGREGSIYTGIEKSIQRVHFLSALFPTTFYLSTANEVSGRGYLNFLEFYRFVRERKRAFVRFYIDRTYYHDPGEMVNFVQGDEDIFQGCGRLPGYFFLGVGLTLFYTAVLFFITVRRSRRVLFAGAVDAALEQRDGAGKRKNYLEIL